MLLSILGLNMILAGIDEAGYGPLLGPLVVGCCAFEVDGAPDGPLPCVWKMLRKHVTKNRLKTRRKIQVNDSKAVYSPAIGLNELERSVLSLASAWNGGCADFNSFLRCVASDALDELEQYHWYAPVETRFPHTIDVTAVQIQGSALRAEMDRSNARVLHLHARIVLERKFNQMLASTRNKGETLFSISAMHLDHLLRTYGDRGLVIFCDRQGGRAHYGSLLRLMFDDWQLEVISESEGRAEYWLARDQRRVRIIFCEKAEALCLPVAVASMLSKYVRELLMHRFNAFWKNHIPDLHPTAGYYSDGERFLKDIERKRRELGIAAEQLVRAR